MPYQKTFRLTQVTQSSEKSVLIVLKRHVALMRVAPSIFTSQVCCFPPRYAVVLIPLMDSLSTFEVDMADTNVQDYISGLLYHRSNT